jgi:hypothetical protein
MLCDSFGPDLRELKFTRREARLVVDAPFERKVDFRLIRKQDGHLYLGPRPGAIFAEPNTAADCRRTPFKPQPVRIDGLGLGSDVCMVTRAGRPVHIMLTSEVEPDATTLTVTYTVR